MVCFTQSKCAYCFVLQYFSRWVGMEMVLPVNSPSPSRGKSMTAAPLRVGMMVTAGVPQLRTMTVTKAMDSAQKQVGGIF